MQLLWLFVGVLALGVGADRARPPRLPRMCETVMEGFLKTAKPCFRETNKEEFNCMGNCSRRSSERWNWMSSSGKTKDLAPMRQDLAYDFMVLVMNCIHEEFDDFNSELSSERLLPINKRGYPDSSEENSKEHNFLQDTEKRKIFDLRESRICETIREMKMHFANQDTVMLRDMYEEEHWGEASRRCQHNKHRMLVVVVVPCLVFVAVLLVAVGVVVYCARKHRQHRHHRDPHPTHPHARLHEPGEDKRVPYGLPTLLNASDLLDYEKAKATDA